MKKSEKNKIFNKISLKKKQFVKKKKQNFIVKNDNLKQYLDAYFNIYGISKITIFRIMFDKGVNKNINQRIVPLKKIELKEDLQQYLYNFYNSKKVGRILKEHIKNTKKFLLEIKHIRGKRNQMRLPVRGQRTHTNARTKKSKYFKVW